MEKRVSVSYSQMMLLPRLMYFLMFNQKAM